MPSFPGQTFTHTLDGLKGWPAPNALDIQGTIGSNVNLNSAGATVFSGCCVHVASVTTPGGGTPSPTNNVPQPVFEMGASKGQMPIFLWVGQDGYDVFNPGVPAGTALGGSGGVLGQPFAGTAPAWVPIMPAGVVMGLVATGGYELETTEFDTAQTYVVNDYLRSVNSNTDANGGKLTNQNAATNTTFAGGTAKITAASGNWGDPGATNWDSVVGIVSRGTYINKNGVTALAFWPVCLPGNRA